MAKRKEPRKKPVGLDIFMAKPFLEGLLNHMQGGVFTINKKKEITSFSKSAMWITGYCLDEVIGKKCDKIFKGDVCRNSCPFDRIIKKGSTIFRSDTEIIGKDGDRIPVNITAFPLKDNKGEIVGMCEIFRDISELKSLTDQLIKSDRFTMLGQLSAGVAHEINNPLNGILTYIKLMLKKLDNKKVSLDEFKKYLTIIERETINLGGIVKNLLDYSRRTEPEVMPIDIDEVIDQSLLLLTDQLKINNIEVKKQCKPPFPKIMGDFGQLQQVFMNIMLNSIQAMPNGGRLTVKTVAQGTPGQECFIKVTISDTGFGIPKKNLDKIFDPLFTTKGGKEGVGLGLGLSIVERIVKAHHGNITVKSEVKEGTTFTIRFPTK
ncbi:hypothetical protein DRQ36_04330 [bacterium]|nr:MAG: hypothetical protein DRQ36_04330 [bacterium]